MILGVVYIILNITTRAIWSLLQLTLAYEILLGNTSMLQIDLFMHRPKHISHDCSTNQRLPFFEQLGPTKLYGNIWNPR